MKCKVKVKTIVTELLKGKSLGFPRQIIFKGCTNIVVFFDGSLSAYGAVAYVHSVEKGGHLLTSTAKVIGRGKYSPPQSEMAAALHG